MRSLKCVLLTVAAGTTLTSAALGQAINDGPVYNGTAVDLNVITGGDYKRGGYSSRADLEVYAIGTPSETGGTYNGANGFGTNSYDDVTFGSTYPNNATPLQLNGATIGVSNLVTNAASTIFTRFSFYPTHSLTAANPYQGTPLEVDLNWGAGWGGNANSFQYFPASVAFGGVWMTLSTADVFNGGPTDRTCGVKMQMFTDAALTVRATTRSFIRRGAYVGHKVGTSDTIGWFSNSAAESNTADIAQASASGGGALATCFWDQSTNPPSLPQPACYVAGNCRATFLGLQGTNLVIAPPTPIDLGTLTDAGSNTTGIVVGNTTATLKWYKITINNGAIDALGTFLDIDGEGSAADLSIAVYDGNDAAPNYGFVVAADAESGSGVNAMLSFGMGRRAATGDGRQRDGRNFYNGAAGLAAGTYYIVVAPAGSTFANGFNVTPGPTGGTGELHIQTNTNGTPLAPSVAPAIAAGDDLLPSPLVAPGQQYVSAGMNPNSPRWIRFTTCRDADDSNPITLDQTGTDAQAGASATFFDNNGNFVAQQVTAAPAVEPAQFIFNSSNPLPAGTYYMALTYNIVQTQPIDPNTNGRWHLRATQGNNGFAFVGAILVNNADCALACGTSDFNGDGDFGTDSDIEAFFACLAGNCCESCYAGGSDFNADGDFGTDADIESFFRVLAGGQC